MTRILVADDDQDMCLLLNRFLTRHGYEVTSMHSGHAAENWLKKNKTSLVLCDFRLEDMNGVELLARIRQVQPEVPVIIITGYSDVKDAVEVMKMGAFDYITKPLYPDEILVTIKKALAGKKNDTAKGPSATDTAQLPGRGALNNTFITGNSVAFTSILRQIELVAPTNYSIIIYGESGSGKEEVAKQIHKRSNRAHKPFVAIDCGALSKELAASELFGHEKGSFTGAISQKTGSLEVANGGTVFLDEIGNLTYDVQVSLLRVIQERKIRKVGGVRDIELDIRIIVASNENLWESARAGKFREDLYHRFNEFSIHVPALRDRKDDIMLFALHFLDVTNDELGKKVLGFTDEVTGIFRSYVWYGNLRELKNVVKRATLLADGDYIDARALPFEINNFNKLQFETEGSERTNLNDRKNYDTYERSTEKEQELDARMRTSGIRNDYEIILEALKKSNYNKSKAADLLKIDRKTLYNKMKLFKEQQGEN